MSFNSNSFNHLVLFGWLVQAILFPAFRLICSTNTNEFSVSRHWWRAITIILTCLMHSHMLTTAPLPNFKFVLSSPLSVPVAHHSSALLQTYLCTVSSAWLAWSKCPPLHPCCHRGNQADQTTQSVMVLDFTLWSCGLYQPHPARYLGEVFFLWLNLCCCWSQICHRSATLLSGFWSLSPNTHRLLLRHSLRFYASHSSAAFPPPPLPPLFPALLMPSFCCGLLVTKAIVITPLTRGW